MALPLLERLPLARAHRVLDIATGTGSRLSDITAAAPDAAVLGVDRAEGMLRAARRAGHRRLAVTDAQQLGIQSEMFDVVTLVFALFHMPDSLRCLREVHRVLRPGGTAGIATWGYDPGLPGVSVWKDELDRAGAAPDPRDPRVMQHDRMDTPEKLGHLLEAAGFPDVAIWSTDVEHQWTLEDLMANQIDCGAPARRLISLSRQARAQCESRVRERLQALAPAELLHRADVLLVMAERSGATAR